MQEHINKGKQNEEFHNALCEKFIDTAYDWKIVVLFYTAIHYLKALGLFKGLNIGDTHMEINQNVNPKSNLKKIVIPQDMWDHYFSLYQYSRTARYNGVLDKKTNDALMKADYSHCKKHLTQFKIYLKSEGIRV